MTRAFRPLLAVACLALLAGPLGGCAGAVIAGGAEAASVAVFGRGIVDIGVSAITGRDCSIVHLDRRQDYCAPREHVPLAELYCSKTLGTVECWADPESFVNLPRKVADTPLTSQEQERQITSRWPKTVNLTD